MTETPDAEDQVDETVRQHPQDPAEGPDVEDEQRDDVPRIHAQEPSEG
jgi:hypothetical protein